MDEISYLVNKMRKGRLIMENLVKKKIVIIEDQDFIRKGLGEMFEGEYDVDFAKDGFEGLYKIMNQKYDLVITDNHMPNLNGVDMLETYNEKGDSLKGTPVLMITTECNPKVKKRGQKAGVNYWFVKPFNTFSLYKMCLKILDPKFSKFL